MGLVTAFATSVFFHYNPPPRANIEALLVVGITALVMITVDIALFKVHKRASTGLDWSHFKFNPVRSAIKLGGLGLTLGALALAYYTFPIYHNDFYKTAWDGLGPYIPLVLSFAVIYIVIIDGAMTEPHDSYYNVGLIATGQWKKADTKFLGPHCRNWIIKGFFVPLMTVFLTKNMLNFRGNLTGMWFDDFVSFTFFALTLLFTIDIIFAMCGYIFALRLIDTHERSSEPTMLGWVVALICYPPFNLLFQDNYTVFSSEDTWRKIFADIPILYGIFGTIIVGLIFIYVWATVAFGNRFSNLSHRGIITSGPYRFTKHPAYIAKNIAWWFMGVPFIAFVSIDDCIRATIMLLIMNWIYYMRAYTEERHLARDPVYRDYQEWILKNGIFRWVPWKLAPKPLPL